MFKSPGEIAFQIFNFPVYWYGIIIAVSTLTGFLLANNFAKYRNIKKDFIIDISPYLVIFGILGARLYYCFLNFDYYFSQPLRIFNIRQGGLSIHGMIIVSVLILFLIGKKFNIKPLNLLDVSFCVLPLCQAIGRWGNFFNSEAFGFPTNLPWKLYIPEANRPYNFINFEYFHPAFLYEFILDMIIFLILYYVLKKYNKSGLVFFLYLILYSLARFFVESVRVDSAFNIVNVFPIAQFMSVILFLIGVFGLKYIVFNKN